MTSWPGKIPIRTAGGTTPTCSPSSTRPRSPTTAPWARPRCSWPPGSPWPRSWPSGWPSRRRCGGAAGISRSSRSWASSNGSWPPTVAWHASITATIGIVIGVPLGIVLGRWLWTLFAEEIGAVPAPTVPVWSVVARRGRRLGAGERCRHAPRPASRPHRDRARPARRIGRGRAQPGALRRCSSRWAAGPAPCRRSGLDGLVELGVGEDVEGVRLRTASMTRSATARRRDAAVDHGLDHGAQLRCALDVALRRPRRPVPVRLGDAGLHEAGAEHRHADGRRPRSAGP